MKIEIPSHLSDMDLVAEVKSLAGRERVATAHLVAHLAEFDARRLYLPAGFSSLFGYCMEVLRLSEAETYNRIEAARAARQFPVILDRLADRSLSLTTVCVLASHLTADNCQELLAAASGKSRREVERLLAQRFPKPDVPCSVRKLPAPREVPPSPPEIASPPSPSITSTGSPVTAPATPVLSPVPRRQVIAPFNDPSTYPAPSRYTTQLGDTSYTIMNPTYGGFFQDNWTLTRNLTLNLGLRYDIETGTSNTDVPSPIQPGVRPLDKNNISPRVGFAYDVRGDGKSVVRGGIGRYYDKVMLNLTSNERRTILGQFIGVNIVNPSFANPLNGLGFQDYKNLKIPSTLTVLDNFYQTPYNDQISIGLAQQLMPGYSMQVDYVHTRGTNEPMTPSVNFFEDPVTHLPRSPAQFGRPFPAYTNITMTTSTGKSAYDGLQMGFQGRTRPLTLGATYILSRTYDNHNGNRGGTPTNWFNLDDEYTYAGSDQRNRFSFNAVTVLPYSIQASAILFVGSPRTIDVNSNLDPFGLGYTGRWLDATGKTVPRDSERTGCSACFPVTVNGVTTLESVSGWDRKLDLRFAKSVKVQHVTLQGMLDVFNALNIRNATSYVRNVASRTYLQPAISTNLFYQPRQIQFGFRVSY